MKMGILGGTFDSIHNGHLGVAEEVKTRLNLTKIIFVPAGQPLLKMALSITAAEDRFEMVRLAIAGKPYFELSRTEIDRAGPSYTVDTIAEFKDISDPGSELFFMLGWDSLSEINRWREPLRLMSMCYPVAVHRPGILRPDLQSMEVSVPGILERVIIMDKPVIDISASVIRDYVVKGLSIRHFVPEIVADYIQRNKLYLE